MKKEISSLGKVSFSNKVIIANPSCLFERQNNRHIVTDKEMNIFEGTYNVYVTRYNNYNEDIKYIDYNGQISEVIFMHTEYYKENQTIELGYLKKWENLYTVDIVEASTSDYMCIGGVFDNLTFKKYDKHNFYKKCCKIMDMEAHNSIFKIKDIVMFKVIPLDFLEVWVLREQKENKIIGFLIDSGLEEHLPYIK